MAFFIGNVFLVGLFSVSKVKLNSTSGRDKINTKFKPSKKNCNEFLGFLLYAIKIDFSVSFRLLFKR